MLMGSLATICRTYCRLHDLPWEGEKAALRYLQTHDPDYLAMLRTCLAETDRQQKVILFTSLVAQTLAPLGPLWTPGITAVALADPAEQPVRVDEALAYWAALFGV